MFSGLAFHFPGSTLPNCSMETVLATILADLDEGKQLIRVLKGTTQGRGSILWCGATLADHLASYSVGRL